MGYLEEKAPYVVACGCGRTFTAEEWGRQPFAGWQKGMRADYWELRDCVCGSTISGPPRARDLQMAVEDMLGRFEMAAVSTQNRGGRR